MLLHGLTAFAAACSLPPAPPRTPVLLHTAAATEAVPAAGLAAAISPEPAPEVDERSLRHAFALASDGGAVAAAGLRLAALLRDAERLPEALAAIEAGIARGGGLPLRVERAGLLRDLGQRHAAVAELRALHDEGHALHPSLRFELAELAWLEGEHAAAAAIAHAAQADPDHTAWLASADATTRQIVADIAAGRGVQFLRVRDLLGNLRGAPLPSQRIAALERLLDRPRLPDAVALEVVERSLSIALRDPSPAVRAQALALAPAVDGIAADAAAIGLADPMPLVRAAAARRAAAAPGADSVGDLLAALAVEHDAAAFRDIHDALARLLPGLPRLPSGGGADDQARAEARDAVQRYLTPGHAEVQ